MSGTAPAWTTLRDRAEALGQEHGKAGIKPYGDLGTADARLSNDAGAALVADLGERWPAGLDWYQVRDLLNAYHGGWCWGAGVCFGCGASGATEDVNADLYCVECASEWEAG